jgi:hypothetical protein
MMEPYLVENTLQTSIAGTNDQTGSSGEIPSIDAPRIQAQNPFPKIYRGELCPPPEGQIVSPFTGSISIERTLNQLSE